MVLFSIQTTMNLLLPHAVYMFSFTSPSSPQPALPTLTTWGASQVSSWDWDCCHPGQPSLSMRTVTPAHPQFHTSQGKGILLPAPQHLALPSVLYSPQKPHRIMGLRLEIIHMWLKTFFSGSGTSILWYCRGSDGKLWTLLRRLRALGHRGFIFRSWVDGRERGKAWSSFWKRKRHSSKRQNT